MQYYDWKGRKVCWELDMESGGFFETINNNTNEKKVIP